MSDPLSASARAQILARIRSANARTPSAPVSAASSASLRTPGDSVASVSGAGSRDSASGDSGASASGASLRDSTRESGAVAIDAAYVALPRDYLRAHHDPAEHDIVALFAERAADYRAVVERVPEAGVPAAVAQALAARAAQSAPRFIAPAGLDRAWLAGLPTDFELVADEPQLSPADLDGIAGVITGCAVAIAETGTIILDHGPDQGRRALTLVPDFHLVIVRAAQVAPDLPDAFARLTPARPHTLISGPSATSDIELIRVEGVHGPRTLHILLTP